MKLSDFRNSEVSKKLQYVNGKPKVVSNTNLNGNIVFYNLDIELLNKINDEVIKNLSGNENDETFIYKLLPYICDIEIDITVEEFSELSKSTNKNFIKFLEMIIELLNETVSVAESVSNIQETANSLNEKLGIQIKTDAQKLEELYVSYDKAENRNEKRRLMREINSLEEKMGLDG